jgi:hypothetical protein
MKLNWIATIGLMVVGVASASAQGDAVTFGADARALGMGGAGIAAGFLNRYNPGNLAFSRKFAFQLPSVAVRASGALGSVSNYDAVGKFIEGSGSDRNQAALDVARNFGKQNSDFGFNLGAMVRYGPAELQLGAVAYGKIVPNDVLKTWSNAGAAGDVPVGASADLSAVAVAMPSVGFGFRLPLKELPLMGALRSTEIGIGVRAKYVRSVYSRYVASVPTLTSGLVANPGTELGGSDTVEQTGIGGDLGVLAVTQIEGIEYSGGVVLNNIVKPKLSFPNPGGIGTFDPLRQSVTVGMAARRGGLVLAGDLVDALGSPDLRAGVEQRIGPVFLRSGYSSRRGVTYGAGLFGFDVAFGKGQPLEIIRNVRF